MAIVIGIDLGTTNSLVAFMDKGKPKVIEDPKEGKLVPSVISFSEDGKVNVGVSAKNQKVINAERTVYSIKRFMGKGVEDLKSDMAYLPFKLTLDSQDQVLRIKVNEKNYTPPELSAIILKELKRRAEAFFGEGVQKAVITVPAYFNDSQRQATKDAGKIAGLEVLRIVNEPTAASLAYGLDKKKQGIIAVYDLGGGTFDISILKLKDGIFEVLATNGDTHLGGDDIDNKLTQLLLDEIIARNSGLEVDDNRELIQKVKVEAEEAKIRLSDVERTNVIIDRSKENVAYRREITRQELEVLVRDLVDRTVEPCLQALDDAGLMPSDIDEVVLVGGSTRIPLVRRIVQETFKQEPHSEMNPDEVVALGAAVQADILAGGIKDLLLLDVTPLSLGIETMGGVMSKLIHRNSTIPTSAKEVFTTFVDGQTSVDIHVLQGERELVKDNRSLARFQLKEIDPMPAGMPRVEVNFLIDANGILNVAAKDLRSGKEQSIEVKPSYGLSDEEVERMVRESIEFARSDIDQRLLIEARQEAETIIRAAEKALVQGKELVCEEELGRIKQALEQVKEAANGTDHNLIRDKLEEFNQVSIHLAEIMMDGALQEALKNKAISEIS